MSIDLMNNIADLAELGFDLGASTADRKAAVEDGRYTVALFSEPVPTKDQAGKPLTKEIEGVDYAGSAFYPSNDKGKLRVGKDGRVNYNVPIQVKVLGEAAPGAEPPVLQTLRQQYVTSAQIGGSSNLLDCCKAINFAQNPNDVESALIDILGFVAAGRAAGDPLHTFRPLAEVLGEFLTNNPGFKIEAMIQSRLVEVKSSVNAMGIKEVERNVVKDANTSERIKAKYPAAWAGQEDFPENHVVETQVRAFCFRPAKES